MTYPFLSVEQTKSRPILNETFSTRWNVRNNIGSIAQWATTRQAGNYRIYI